MYTLALAAVLDSDPDPDLRHMLLLSRDPHAASADKRAGVGWLQEEGDGTGRWGQRTGDWGLRTGDWGLRTEDWELGEGMVSAVSFH